MRPKGHKGFVGGCAGAAQDHRNLPWRGLEGHPQPPLMLPFPLQFLPGSLTGFPPPGGNLLTFETGLCISGQLCLSKSSHCNLRAISDMKPGVLDFYLLLFFPLQAAASLCLPSLEALQMPKLGMLQTKMKA